MDRYQAVTDRIVGMLVKAVRPWHQDWSAGGGRPLHHDGTPYRGANVMNLWAAAMARGFTGQHWMTYGKAQELGGQVRKGAKSEFAFFVGTMQRTEERDGQEGDRAIPFLKAYYVFSTDEIDVLPAQYYTRAEVVKLDPAARMPAVDTWIGLTGAKIVYGGGRAFYRRAADEIHIPEFSSFETATGFYSTTLHELTHWTGDEHRLDRTKGRVFGDPTYTFEELVAELAPPISARTCT